MANSAAVAPHDRRAHLVTHELCELCEYTAAFQQEDKHMAVHHITNYVTDILGVMS